MGNAGGVEVRESSIRVHFTHEGKPCKETLKTDGEPLAPTPANVKYARRMVGEIKDKIRHGTFNYADYFPASLRATTGRSITVGEHLEAWIKLQIQLEDSTIKAYRIALDWWKSKIGDKSLKALRHSDILAALASMPDWSAKTRNNKASVLRQALDLAMRDELLGRNPIEGLEHAPQQKEPPDPFSLEEVELILAHMRKKYDPQIEAYFAFKFFAGPRTGESLALRWQDVDFNQRQVLISSTITLGDHKERTKTKQSRLVDLNSRAMAAINSQKERTMLMPDGWIFRAPSTGERWADDSGPRKRYWMPTLKKLGIRYRSPYNTRHTYATMMLMAGAKPGWAALQLGHSVEMFYRIYSKWIESGHNNAEVGKVEALIFPQQFPGKSAEG